MVDVELQQAEGGEEDRVVREEVRVVEATFLVGGEVGVCWGEAEAALGGGCEEED